MSLNLETERERQRERPFAFAFVNSKTGNTCNWHEMLCACLGVSACFAPKGLWYEQSFRSTAAESVQTVRRQTAHFESQSDPQTHSHEVDGQLDDRGFQEGRQRRCQLDEGAFEQGCHRWCVTSQVTRRRPPTNVGVRRQRE